MESTFGWLDTDDAQRRHMLEVVELFKDEGTVDEIGIGTVRDTIANALYPGLSVLQTRLRYVLFVPWLVNQAAASSSSTADALRALRRAEVQLIGSLLAGTTELSERDAAGVIGSRARGTLKTMPSSLYWGALGAWRIRTWDEGVEGHLRRSLGLRSMARSRPAADDPETRDDLAVTGFASGFPSPPADLLHMTDFRLTTQEAGFVADRIRVATRGTLLAWLVDHPPRAPADAVWDLPRIQEAPESVLALVEHGRRLSVVMHGASLLYNLLLAENAARSELAEQYREDLDAWTDEVHGIDVLANWDVPGFWRTITSHNPRISGPTRRFVDTWRDAVMRAPDVSDSAECRDLISRRERQIKGARARIGNQAALDRWNGGSGLGRLGYRWEVAQRLLADLVPALEVTDARP